MGSIMRFTGRKRHSSGEGRSFLSLKLSPVSWDSLHWARSEKKTTSNKQNGRTEKFCIERMVWFVKKLWVIRFPTWTGLIVEALRPKKKDWALHLIMGQSWEVWVRDWLTKLKECCRGKNLIRECQMDYRVGKFNPWRRQTTSITFPPDQPHSPARPSTNSTLCWSPCRFPELASYCSCNNFAQI